MFNSEWVNVESLGGNQAIEMYNFSLMRRRKKFPYDKKDYHGVIEDLDSKGYSVLKNCLDKNYVLKLNEKIQSRMNDYSLLKTNDKRYKTFAEPLLCCEEIIDLATTEPIFNVASEFYKCIPSLGVSKIHKSLVNDLPKSGTNFFHYDRNSLWFLKAFIYLNNVDENGGPFTYVEGSHKNKIKNLNNRKQQMESFRFTDEEITDYYGKDNIKQITGEVGDVIFANTVGIHRGTKTLEKERTMITMNFVIHPEDWMQHQRFQKVYDTNLHKHEDKMPLFRFLNRVKNGTL